MYSLNSVCFCLDSGVHFIASYCDPDNKVSLGLVEGLNNKIRVLQRRAYGYRDEKYLKLKIIATFLAPLPRMTENDPH